MAKEILSGIIFNIIVDKRIDCFSKSLGIFNYPKNIEQIQKSNDFDQIMDHPLSFRLTLADISLCTLVKRIKNNETVMKLSDTDIVDEIFSRYSFGCMVNNNLKKLYGEEVLPHKEEIIKFLKQVESIGKEKVIVKLNEFAFESYGIALTENEIYDYENKQLKK